MLENIYLRIINSLLLRFAPLLFIYLIPLNGVIIGKVGHFTKTPFFSEDNLILTKKRVISRKRKRNF